MFWNISSDACLKCVNVYVSDCVSLFQRCQGKRKQGELLVKMAKKSLHHHQNCSHVRRVQAEVNAIQALINDLKARQNQARLDASVLSIAEQQLARHDHSLRQFFVQIEAGCSECCERCPNILQEFALSELSFHPPGSSVD